MTVTPAQLQLRNGTAAQWTAANPIMLVGEAGYEWDTNKLKFGDGVTHWNSLPYFSPGTTGGGDTAVVLYNGSWAARPGTATHVLWISLDPAAAWPSASVTATDTVLILKNTFSLTTPFDFAKDRPFAADSPLNTPIPAGTRYYDHPLLHRTGANAVQHWYVVDASKVWVGSPTDPVWTATVADFIDPSMNRNSPAGTITFRAPAGMTTPGSGDSILLVIDGNDPNRLIEIYNATCNAGTHTVTQGAAGHAVLDLRTSWGIGRTTTNEGVRAINSSWLAGLITARDVTAPRIDHAFVIALNDEMLQSKVNHQHRYPATAWDNGNKGGPLHSGTRIAVPFDAPTPPGLSPFGIKVWNALKEYGAFVGDYIGGGYSAFYYDANMSDTTWYDPLMAWWGPGKGNYSAPHGSVAIPADLELIGPYLRVCDYQPDINNPAVVFDSPRSDLNTVFTGTDGASWPAFWTATGTVDIQSNQGRMYAASGYNGASVQSTSATASANQRIRGSFKVLTNRFNNFDVNLRLQQYGAGSVTFSIQTDFDGGGAYLQLVVNDNYASVSDRVGGWYELADVMIHDPQVNDIVHFEYEVVGTRIRGRVWFNTDARPDWQIVAFDPLNNDYRYMKVGMASATANADIRMYEMVVDTPQPDLAFQAPYINNQTGSSYTIGLVDVMNAITVGNAMVTMNNASANTLYLPDDSDLPEWIPGLAIPTIQLGAGQTTYTGSGSAAVNPSGLTSKARAQNSVVWVLKTAANTFSLSGDLAAS